MTDQKSQTQQPASALGRMELAQLYFPHILPRSCRAKSTLFTNIWGGHNRPFSVGFLRGKWRFPTEKLRLSSVEHKVSGTMCK